MNIFLKPKELFNSLGFTLLELLLSLAIMVIIAGVTIPIAWPFVTQNDLDVSVVVTTQTLRRAQSLAMSMQGDSVWGVKLDTQRVTLFKGESYDNRNVDFDEVFNLSNTIILSGINEIYFSKLFGVPNSYGEIIMSNNHQQSRSILLSQYGVISN